MKTFRILVLCLVTSIIFANCSGGVVIRGETISPDVSFFETGATDLAWLPNNEDLSVRFTSGSAPRLSVYTWNPDQNHLSIWNIPSGGLMFKQPYGDMLVVKNFYNVEYWGALIDPETATLTNFAKAEFFQWFPDGTRILYGDYSTLGIFDISTGSNNILWEIESELYKLSGFLLASVSPDGNTIAVVKHDPDEICYIGLDDGTRTCTETFELFDPTHAGLKFKKSILTWVHNQSSAIIGEAHGFLTDEMKALERSGYAILYIHSLEGNCFSDAFPGIVPEHQYTWDIDWSPDGKRIALIGNYGEKVGVYIIDAESEVIQDWLQSVSCVE